MRTLPHLALLLSLVACGDPAASPEGGDPPGTPTAPASCDTAPAANVTARDTTDNYVRDTVVTWSTADGGAGDCPEDETTRTWRCEPTDGSDLTVTASREGYADASTTLSGPDGCRAEEDDVRLDQVPAGEHFEEDRTYFVRLIEDDYECAHSWELFEMNCYRWADLCADGRAEVVVTDITNGGVYRIEDDEIVFTFVADGDLGAAATFEIVDENTLVDDLIGDTWTLDTAGELSYSVCD